VRFLGFRETDVGMFSKISCHRGRAAAGRTNYKKGLDVLRHVWIISHVLHRTLAKSLKHNPQIVDFSAELPRFYSTIKSLGQAGSR